MPRVSRRAASAKCGSGGAATCRGSSSWTRARRTAASSVTAFSAARLSCASSSSARRSLRGAAPLSSPSPLSGGFHMCRGSQHQEIDGTLWPLAVAACLMKTVPLTLMTCRSLS